MMFRSYSVLHSIYSFITLLSLFSFVVGNHIKGLDDSILFKINWPGNDDSLLESPNYEKLEMISVNNEKFQCLVPIAYGESIGNEDRYNGPNALELLMPLFKKKICTLRLESFWTYEMCHGQWIKQYHEGREENGQRFQEYSLGVQSVEALEKQAQELNVFLKENPNHEVPQTKLEGGSMPYFAVNYSDGTKCDLTGNPRVTRVLYVCYEEGKHAVYSIKETYTCEYEVIVLSSLLCQHPSYRPQEVPQTNLHCIPLQEGTKRPKNLLHIEAESLKLRTHGTLVSLGGDITKGSVRIEVIDEDDEPEILSDFEGRETRRSPFPPQPSIDRKLVEDFLNGDYCLQGGSGWWKYEFCYGKLVQQYHEEKDGSKYSITLGVFDLEAHKTWIQKHPLKKFNSGNSQVSHFYGGGEYCDEIARPRQVEVRIKCKDTLSSQNSVTLYLLEPKVCEYVLVIETSLICSLLDNADELGLFSRVDPKMDSSVKLPVPPEMTETGNERNILSDPETEVISSSESRTPSESFQQISESDIEQSSSSNPGVIDSPEETAIPPKLKTESVETEENPKVTLSTNGKRPNE